MPLPDEGQYLSAKLVYIVGLLRIHTTVLETRGGSEGFQLAITLFKKKKIHVNVSEAVAITNNKITLNTQFLFN